MAINPLIALQAKPLDVGAAFRNALLNVKQLESIDQNREQRARDERLQPLREQLLQAQVQSAEQGLQTPQQQLNQRQLDNLNSVANFSRQNVDLATGPNQNLPLLAQRLSTRRAQLVEAGLPTTETDQAFQLLEQNPDQLAADMQRAIQAQDVLSNRGGLTAGQREFAGLTEGLSEADALRARRIELGLDPRAGISAQERIAADPNLTQQVAGSEAVITGAKEGAKLTKQLAFKPAIQRAVKLAENQAAAEGEVFTDLARSKAALPGLNDVVGKLKELAPIATSTLTGRAFNTVSKELGFGATKGATARATFVATVRNQVLPLLRETFGAAFTAAEGEKLEAAFADPDASPQEKVAQLESFIDQKRRSIETKERQAEILSPEASQPQSTRIVFDAQGNIVQ